MCSSPQDSTFQRYATVTKGGGGKESRGEDAAVVLAELGALSDRHQGEIPGRISARTYDYSAINHGEPKWLYVVKSRPH